jgi:hypothetical protein
LTDKKRKGKYGNLSPFSRFLHKNTGFIVMGTIVTIVLIGWTIYDGELEFFDSWNCEKILYYTLSQENYGYPDHDDLTEKQHLKLHKLYANDCSNDSFIPPETLDQKHGT